MRNDHVWRAGGEQGVAVGARLRRDLGSDESARARAVVDHHLFTQHARQPIGDDAHHRVRCATGGKRDEHAHRLGRIRLGMQQTCGEQ